MQHRAGGCTFTANIEAADGGKINVSRVRVQGGGKRGVGRECGRERVCEGGRAGGRGRGSHRHGRRDFNEGFRKYLPRSGNNQSSSTRQGKYTRDEEKTEKKRGRRKEGNVNLQQGEWQPSLASLAALNRKDMDGQQPV